MREAHAALAGASLHGARGEATATRRPPTCCFNFSQLAALGHPGSEGRTRRREAAPAEGAASHDAIPGRAGIAPMRLRNVRRFIR
jgi:hypothetical protein